MFCLWNLMWFNHAGSSMESFWQCDGQESAQALHCCNYFKGKLFKYILTKGKMMLTPQPCCWGTEFECSRCEFSPFAPSRFESIKDRRRISLRRVLRWWVRGDLTQGTVDEKRRIENEVEEQQQEEAEGCRKRAEEKPSVSSCTTIHLCHIRWGKRDQRNASTPGVNDTCPMYATGSRVDVHEDIERLRHCSRGWRCLLFKVLING